FLSGFHLTNKFARKFSGADLSQYRRHLFADVLIHNFWSNGEIAPLCGIGNQVAHTCDSCFVDHIDNEFQFVQAFEVGQFRRVTSANQSLERGSNKRSCSAAQYCLLPEKIGLRFFPKSCFDDAGPGASDVSSTVSLCARAAGRDLLPLCNPMTTSNPLSRRFRAWAWPCEPNPITPQILPRSGSSLICLSR